MKRIKPGYYACNGCHLLQRGSYSGVNDATLSFLDMQHCPFWSCNFVYLYFATNNGTPEGKEELGEYDLSERDIMDIKTIILEYPYLMRRYDHDEGFAKEIMEYAGIIHKQL